MSFNTTMYDMSSMKYKFILVLLFFIIFFTSSYCETFFLGGIQVNEEDHLEWVDSLKKNGFNTLTTTVYAKQGDWNSSNLWFDKKNESVESELRIAKESELKTILILRVALDHAFKENKFLWHGMIMPKTQIEIKEWFKRYKKFVVKWAKIAEKEKVDVFGIGSEMNSLTSTKPIEDIPPLIEYYLNKDKQNKRTELLKRAYKKQFGNPKSFIKEVKEEQDIKSKWAKEIFFKNSSLKEKALKVFNLRKKYLNSKWLDIIKEVRKHYKGKITYAANFDQYQDVNFWKALDFIGINSYFELRKANSNKSLSFQIDKSWQNIFEKISKFRYKNQLEDKKVIFTEIGYTFREGSTISPWASSGYSINEKDEKTDPEIIFWKKQAINYQERVLAIESLARTCKKYQNILTGALYWKLSTKIEQIKIEPFVHILSNQKDLYFNKALLKLKNSNNSLK